METVYILTVIDGLDDLLLIDMLRQRQLYDKPIDISIFVEAVDTCQQFLLTDGILETNQGALETPCFSHTSPNRHRDPREQLPDGAVCLPWQ